MRYNIFKFFDEETLQAIQSQLEVATWENGSNTFTNLEKAYQYKNNLQTTIDQQIIFNSLDTNTNYLDFTLADSTNNLLITKTPVGGFYKPHFDHVVNGDFSTTIFLNDPSEYDGGELCLLIDNKEQKFKLDAGYGIVYEIGTPHRVNTVTGGERLACVFWTKSLIHDMDDLKKYRYYDMMRKRYEEKVYENCYDFCYDLCNIFNSKCNKIIGRWVRD